MPSIVDPSLDRGGAWTATRGLVAMLERPPARTTVDVLPLPLRGPHAHRWRRVGSVAASLVTHLPAKALFAHDRRLRRDLRSRLAGGGVDLVLLNGADLLWLLPALPASLPKVLIAHNLEHQLYAAQVERAGSRWPMARRLLAADVERLRRHEEDGMRAIDGVVFLSRDDEAAAKDVIPALRSLVVPPVFHAPRRPRSTAAGRRGLHVGMMANFDWWPNREGLRWFADHVLPEVRDRVTLHLFGPGGDRALRSVPGAVDHGFVATPVAAYDACDLMVCPIVSGGGICVKSAEAAYHRMPFLTTSFGVRGLPLESDPGIVVLDRASDWVRFLATTQASRLRTHALATSVADAFAAPAHAGALDAFLRAILK